MKFPEGHCGFRGCSSCNTYFGEGTPDDTASQAGVNPKDLVGSSKVDLTTIPPAAAVACALALMDGAAKYGPYNWRSGPPIQVRTYLSAMKRHIDAFLDGEDIAPDSGVDHLGHVMAGAAILIDALSLSRVVDDRPPPGNGALAQANAKGFLAGKKNG